MILSARNVNELFALGVDYLSQSGQREDSRNGPVVVAPTPVLSIYEQPCERVLFSSTRDANPMFHLHESLWMLAGRNDSASLDRYVGDFGARFAENYAGVHGEIHGAYGRRWRRAFGMDQLEEIVRRLRANPQDRQCVLQMWDASNAHSVTNSRSHWAMGHDDLLGEWKDRPCNTHAYLRVRSTGRPETGASEMSTLPVGRVLDLTVLCRSNDIVWGAYGANAVHFSVLQEYLAGRIGVRVGRMYQFSNNFHGYVDALDRLGEPHLLFDEHDPYDCGEVYATAIGEDWEHWDKDVRRYMRWHDDVLWCLPGDSTDIGPPDGFYNMDFFVGTAGVMAACNWLWKNGRRQDALSYVGQIDAPDWRLAVENWMHRRLERKENGK